MHIFWNLDSWHAKFLRLLQNTEPRTHFKMLRRWEPACVLLGALEGTAEQKSLAAVLTSSEQPHVASCIFVGDKIMNWPILVLVLACVSSYSSKIQEFQENLNTRWSELTAGSAGMGGQAWGSCWLNRPTCSGLGSLSFSWTKKPLFFSVWLLTPLKEKTPFFFFSMWLLERH